MTGYTNSKLYFMSGTGNTYRVATWASDVIESHEIDTAVTPFEKADPSNDFTPGEETLLGLLLPTHGFTAPWAMIRFALTLPRGDGTHVFISASRGGTKIGRVNIPGFEGTAAYLLGLILTIKGYKIRGALGVDMPLNWTVVVPGVKEETAEHMNARQKPKVESFVNAIINGEKRFGAGSIVSLILGLLILPFSLGYLFIARFFLSKLFFPTIDCDGCGLCAANCPTNAIEMRGEENPRPYWTFNCDSCMRCMNFCPKHAIEASHLLAVGLFYIGSIPVGYFLMRLLLENVPFLQAMNSGIFNAILQYGYMLLAFTLTYYVFHQLIRVKFFNRIFTKLTLTHYYRRYRQPGVNLKDLQ